MLRAADIKLGIVDATHNSAARRVVPHFVDFGFAEHNIEVRELPSLHHAVMGVHFFAEYTDVDCVLVIGDDLPGAEQYKQLLELQVQWNMPIDCVTFVGDVSRVVRIVQQLRDVVLLQGRMAAEAPEERVAMPPRKDSVN